MSFNIEVEGGKSVRLPTAGKYCDRDIIIKALGGSDGGASGIYMAKITPAEEMSSFTLDHNLGTTDLLLVAVWAETLGDFVPTANQTAGDIWLKTDIPVRVTSSENRENYECFLNYNSSSGNIIGTSMKNSGKYVGNPTENNTFEIKAGSSSAARFYGGVTYTVIAIASSAFVDMGVQ